MTILVGSRYAYGFLGASQVFRDDDINTYVFKMPREPLTGRYKQRIVVEGDRLESLAYEYYQDATQWWRLADINPDLEDLINLVPGSVLRVPHV